MNHSARRRVGVVALAIGILVTPACTAAPREGAPVPAVSSDPPAPSDDAVAETVDTSIPLELTFEAGDDLEAGSIAAEWIDPFATDPEFSLLSPDDGNGSWSYTDDTNGCTIVFYQGTLKDFAAEDSDRASTISAIAGIAQGRDAEVTPEVVETYGDDFPIDQTQEGGTASLWGLGAELTDGSSWADSARFFNAIQSIYYFAIDCPSGTNAYDEHDRVVGPKGLALHVTETAGSE